jgi:intracellular sulfur oxidation DsrE/DsrF family protein
VKDPETGKPATRNIFYPTKPNTLDDVEDPKSKWQDSSMQGLQARGCTFLSCHNATEAQAGTLVKKLGLSVTQEEVTNDLQAHTVPGIQIMPAMVAAMAVLQSEGHFTYLSVG